MNVTVQRWGNSLAVRIPKAVAVESGLEDGTIVDLKPVKGKVILLPLRPRQYSLAELLAGVTDVNRHHEIETGAPVGGESW